MIVFSSRGYISFVLLSLFELVREGQLVLQQFKMAASPQCYLSLIEWHLAILFGYTNACVVLQTLL